METMASSIINKSDYLLTLFFMLAALVQGVPYSENGKGTSTNSQNHLQHPSSAIFTTRNNTRVIAQRGGLAILPCSVKWNPTATVSWIRRRDFQLLTVGLSTYSSDDRFLVEHARHMGHWSLRIKSVRDEDKGMYECQLSIHPTQSIFVELRVVEAIAEITGAPDLHIDEGSTLRLECKLKRATENPAYVFWYHNDKMVNYDLQNGFSVSSVQSQQHHHSGSSKIQNHIRDSGATGAGGNGNDGINSNLTNTIVSIPQTSYLIAPTTSILTIKEVSFKHVGNYTCAPSNARQTSITVHVLRGEKPAAMQHANRSSTDDTKEKSSAEQPSTPTKPLYFLSIFFLIYILNEINR